MPDHIASARDADGYAPIGDYAVIGNGRSVALVAGDGSVDWWAAPFLDSPPAFAAVLDPNNGGRFLLAPDDPSATVSRRYVPHTNVLETVYRGDEGVVRVTDSLNSGNAGALPWTELARRVECLEGSMSLRVVVAPGNGLGEWEPWALGDSRATLFHAGDMTLALRCSEDIDLELERASVSASLELTSGGRAVLALVASDAEPLFLADTSSIDSRIDLTIDDWRHWSSQVRWTGEGRERVVRSALALKLLMMAQTGAVAAAATTSLPERIGGSKNWDYRYAWIRDAALTIDAMAACGLQEETHAAVAWLLRTIRRHGPAPHVMYTLAGELPAASRLAAVPGYRDSRPVMIGNDASSQTQLGVYGDLFGTVSNWVAAGHVLDVATARQLADLADRCADVWRRDDAGIWELGDNLPYTSSKMSCWRALDQAAHMADHGHIAGHAGRWRAEAERIRSWVQQHCWSEKKQAYTFFAGSEDLDASVLLGARFGFDREERMSTTVDAIVSELGVGPFIYRYSGVRREEEAFIACSYWAVEALAYVGRHEEASALMRDLEAVPGPLGLLSEMAVPATGELVGNVPQALSHLALINAAVALRRTSPRET